jgi:hypothetical protein
LREFDENRSRRGGAAASTFPTFRKVRQPSSALIRPNRVNSHEVYVSRLDGDGEFPCKFIGTGVSPVKFSGVAPSRYPILSAPFSSAELHHRLPASFESRLLLCWELTGQHPISNKARAAAGTVSLRLVCTAVGPPRPPLANSPASSTRSNVFPIFPGTPLLHAALPADSQPDFSAAGTPQKDRRPRVSFIS